MTTKTVTRRVVTAKNPDAWAQAVNDKWASITPSHPTIASFSVRIIDRGDVTPSGRTRFTVESTTENR